MKLQSGLRIGGLCAALALLAAALLSAMLPRHAAVLWHYLRGEVENCTLAESFESSALSRLYLANVDEIRASSRVLRKDEQYSLWSTPAGDFWMPTPSGQALIRELAEQKRDIYGVYIRPGDVVLDTGASVGVFTRKALWAGAAKVVAIEPGPENLECLRRNFATEIAHGRVVLFPKGVWDKDDVLQFSLNPTNSGRDGFIAHLPNGRVIAVPVTTIDKMVEELHLPKVDFIKMDIEGAERRAIVGAQRVIANFRPRMALSVYHLAGDDTMIPKLVADIVRDYRVTKTCLCTQDDIHPEVAFFY